MGVSHLISIVGAGPGDPELLTLKAFQRLKEADVILYDGVMGNRIIELKEISAQKIYVGKSCSDGQNQTKRQDSIHELFLFWAQKNKKVVRLKAGDPMIFGRGAEEIRFCKKHLLNYEVIPGITAAAAGSSLMEVPLTERGKSAMTLFFTGQCKNGKCADVEAAVAVLKTGGSVVVYMAIKSLSDLSEAILKAGAGAQIQVQILSKISQPDQKTITSTLGELAGLIKNTKLETPSIVVLGKHAFTI